MREVETLPDLAVRQPVGRQPRDLELLRGELVPCLWDASTTRLARRAKLLPGSLGERAEAQPVEQVTRGAKRSPGLRDAPLAP